MQYNKLKIDILGRVVYVDNKEIFLTRMEFDVLYFLALNSNIAFTKKQIYELVSKDNYTEAAYIIKNVIYQLSR